jgi:hypothetical protein
MQRGGLKSREQGKHRADRKTTENRGRRAEGGTAGSGRRRCCKMSVVHGPLRKKTKAKGTDKKADAVGGWRSAAHEVGGRGWI